MRVRSGEGRLNTLPLFIVNSHIAAGGDPLRIYVTSGDSLVIRVFDDSGKLLQIIRRRTPPVPIKEAERSLALNRLRNRSGNKAANAFIEEMFGSIPNQRFYPAISELRVDSDGYLWTLNHGEGWSVFDATGRWLGILPVPLVRLYDIGTDYVVGVSIDSLGVERVVEIRIARSRHGDGF